MDVDFDDRAASQLLGHLRHAGVDAQGINVFAGCDVPIRWAEVVPLWFLRQLKESCKFVILSQGCGGSDGASSMHRGQVSPGLLPNTLHAGGEVCKFAQASEKRVFVLYSGDLSHMHGNDKVPCDCHGKQDPKYMNPQYVKAVPEAAAYDGYVGQWAASLRGELLLDKAAKILPKAMSCGYDGFVMLEVALR